MKMIKLGFKENLIFKICAKSTKEGKVRKVDLMSDSVYRHSIAVNHLQYASCLFRLPFTDVEGSSPFFVFTTK